MGDPNRAVAILDEALATADRLGYRAFEAELHRARGEILLKRDPANPAPAEDALLTAIAVANQQGTRSFGCARRWRSPNFTNRPTAPPTPTPSSRRRSKAFRRRRKCPRSRRRRRCSRRWRKPTRSRREATQRQRLTQLHVAYGNALFAARGYGAPETTEAFAKARESASWRKGCARAVGGRLRLMGRQLRARRLAIDAGARSGLPQRRRGETRFARGRRRPSRRRDHLLVRRRVSRGAGSLRTRARLVPTRPRRRSGLSLRTGPRRRHDGLSCDCVMASRRGRSRDFAHRPDADRGSRTSPMSARSRLEECTRPCSN